MIHPLSIALMAAGLMGCTTFEKVDFTRVVTNGRDGWQLPDRVIDALEIEPGDRVAEIGAGEGYWLPWLAAAVGSEGVVYAIEVEDDLVDSLTERIARDALANVIVVRGDYDDPLLPDHEVDLAITSNTFHHIEDRVAYFRRLTADLSSRGRVVHLEDRHDVPIPFRWFQSSGHWSDPVAVREQMSEAGYHRVSEFEFLPIQSFQIFAPGDGGP